MYRTPQTVVRGKAVWFAWRTILDLHSTGWHGAVLSLCLSVKMNRGIQSAWDGGGGSGSGSVGWGSLLRGSRLDARI